MLAVYKGLTPPLTTVPMVNAVVMSVNEFAKRCMGIKYGQETLNQSLVCGMLAGLANSYILGPIELVKCKLQIQ